MKNKKPALLALLGFPGSGKTYFSERFAKQFDFVHLNSDFIRTALFEKPTYTSAENGVVFRAFDYLVESLLAAGVSVIYDANLPRREYRERLQQIAKRTGAKYLLVWLQVDREQALNRIKQRVKTAKSARAKIIYPAVDEGVVDRIGKRIEPPTTEPHIVLNSLLSYKNKEKAVVQRLRTK